MRELDKTRHQIKVEDLPAFEKKIAPIKREATDAISSFGDLQAILKERRTDDNCQGTLQLPNVELCSKRSNNIDFPCTKSSLG